MLALLVILLAPLVLWAIWELLECAKKPAGTWLLLGPPDPCEAERHAADRYDFEA